MVDKMNRRQALAKVGGAALGIEAVMAVGAAPAYAAQPTVRGAWLLTPTQGGQPATFRAIACFAAGSVFVTTGSDQAGTGLGEWSSVGSRGFAFTYLNFHFGQDGKLSNTVKVQAKGAFHGSTLTGRATLTILDPSGKPMSLPEHFTFKGKRIAVESP
jgi:hypothetical protein